MSASGDVTVTQAERIKRLRAQLQGLKPLGTFGGAKVAPAAATGLLYGVMLRGAARMADGRELTDLETQMVKFLRPLASEEEIRELGRVFADEQSSHALGMFPDVLTSRGMEQGYAFEDLVKDLPALRADVAAQPNLSLVDLDRLDEGAPLDSPEFIEGMSAYGHGVTVVTASDHHPDARATAKPEQVLVELKAYSCQRESNELGDDELYWAHSASSDKAGKQSGVTREYGDVATGDYRALDAGTVLFNGQVDKFLTAHIICWEADHSSSQWRDDMHDTMRKISDILFEMADKLAQYGGHFPVPEYHDLIDYFEIVGMIALAIAALLELFRNHDDEVAARTFVFDRAALGKWANDLNAIANFEFDGGSEGHFTLIAKATSSINARPRATSMPRVLPGGQHTWSPDVPFPSGTMSGTPALAEYYDKLYCVVPGFAGSGSLWWSTLENGAWRPFAQIPGAVTSDSPSLTAQSGPGAGLWCAYNRRNAVVVTRFSGSSWSGQETVAENIVLGSPALSTYGQRLICVVRGPENKLYWNERDYDRWGTFKPFASGTTCDSPALGQDGSGVPHCVVRGSNGKGLYLSKYISSTPSWSSFQGLPLGSASARPALAHSAEGLVCMFRADDLSEELRYATLRDNTWSPVTKHPTATSADGPALVKYSDTTPEAPYGYLYCVHRG
ncbi:hypothetical protein OG897_18485 [Streptomyces sp. NBC_00237]|uniref:hypothetical protein n=1 Tax=Streptomyces sp. NBC_00237 TaxID=2975687 RepID=UPI00224D7790|nr:hypothetical protein [Streptomyces sp. NBC_00237]MCX5203426.1 hypothetical protein [Streptomyces sp. NBC_00237]